MRNPRTILITGAGSGLGAALALDYAAPGVRLILTGRNAERLESTATAARARGAEVVLEPIDVTDSAAMAQMIAAQDRIQPIELLIANAGITSGTQSDGALETLASAQAVLATNLGGVINSVIPLLPLMQARRHGHIALIGSVAGLRGLADSPAYCASKAGVRLYGESLRGALASSGLLVSVVAPGFFTSPMSARFIGAQPFRLPLATMARRIRQGLDRGRPRITVPWILGILLRLADLIPPWLGDRIMARVRFHIDPAAPPR